MDEVGREKVISNTLDRLLVFSAILIGAAICYLAGILGILPISILIFGLIFSAVTGKDNALRVTDFEKRRQSCCLACDIWDIRDLLFAWFYCLEVFVV